MKITLVRETLPIGGAKYVYWIEVNGEYIGASITCGLEEAKGFFDNVCQNGGKLVLQKKEVLDSYETDN